MEKIILTNKIKTTNVSDITAEYYLILNHSIPVEVKKSNINIVHFKSHRQCFTVSQGLIWHLIDNSQLQMSSVDLNFPIKETTQKPKDVSGPLRINNKNHVVLSRSSCEEAARRPSVKGADHKVLRKNPCVDGHDESPVHEAEWSDCIFEESSEFKCETTEYIESVVNINGNVIIPTDENVHDYQNIIKTEREENNNVFIIILNCESSTSHNHSSSSTEDSTKILDLSSAFMTDNFTQDNVLVENVNLSLRKIKKIQNDVSNIISATHKGTEHIQRHNAEIGPKCFLVLNCSVASDVKCEPTLNRASAVRQYSNRCNSKVTVGSVGKTKLNIQKPTEQTTEENLIQIKQEVDSFILVVKDDNDNCDNTLQQSDEAIVLPEEGQTDSQQSIEHSEEGRINDKQTIENSDKEYDSLIDMFMIKKNCEKQQRTVIIRHEGDVKYYVCDKCDKRYTNPKSLKAHHYSRCLNRKLHIESVKLTRKKNSKQVKKIDKNTLQEDQKRSFSCRKCSECFEDKLMYRNHIRYKCKVRRAVPFICEFCGKEFGYRSNFWAHKKAHKNLREYVCQKCGKGYNTSLILANHIKRVHMGQQCLYICAHCGIKSKSKSHIEAHKKVHFLSEGESIETPFHCECGESFISKHELSNHKYVHHVSKKCPHCPECFLSSNKLKQHKKEFHSTEIGNRDTTQQCPLCHKDYASVISLRHHLQNKHDLDDPNVAKHIECNVCYKTYSSFAFYIKHKREAHNEQVSVDEIEAFKEVIVPPWEQEAFEKKRKSREEERSRRQCPESGNRRGRPPGRKGMTKFEGTEHVCDICGKTYTKRHLMKSHVIRVHSAEGAYCDLCQKGFMNKGQYYRHRYEVHRCAEEERTCGVCGKVFDKIRSLWAHKIVHDSVANFGCPECDSRFKRKGDLTRHLRDKHKLRREGLGETPQPDRT